MKKIKLLILLFVLAGCVSNKYMLDDANKEDKKHLIDYIEELKQKNEAGDKPLIVVDGKPLRYDIELKSSKLGLKKSNIEKLDVMSKSSSNGKCIWGDYANDGVVLVTTNLVKNTNSKDLDASKVIYIVEGKRVEKKEAENLTQDAIETIQVIKPKSKIQLFNGDKFDGVVIINMKKE